MITSRTAIQRRRPMLCYNDRDRSYANDSGDIEIVKRELAKFEQRLTQLNAEKKEQTLQQNRLRSEKVSLISRAN